MSAGRLSPGDRLGPYEVVSPLGAGGMGEVYRARDTRLDREVAIKVLPDAVAGSPERLKRFEREARAVASLNHPHVLTLYDVGTHAGVPYVPVELAYPRIRSARGIQGDGVVDALEVPLPGGRDPNPVSSPHVSVPSGRRAPGAFGPGGYRLRLGREAPRG